MALDFLIEKSDGFSVVHSINGEQVCFVLWVSVDGAISCETSGVSRWSMEVY